MMRHSLVVMSLASLIVVILLIGSCKEPGTAATHSGDSAAQEKKPECEGFFYSSLHATGEGMRYWYEEEGGFMNITEIPYAKLDCKSCHVSSCDKCHAEKVGEAPIYSVKKARALETCTACHSRAKATFATDEKAKTMDVHIAAGMTCADCHTGKDVHGDGLTYHSMRDPGAVSASCDSADCHGEIDESIRSHKIHKDTLHCTSCHVSNTMTCYNCHFGKFLETGKRAGNFVPGKSWLLLVNHEGKVTSGNAQTLVYKGKKFITYAPYFTHSVMKKGRECNECHNNTAMQKISAGEKVPVMTFENGKINGWQGVIPLVTDKLGWTFLDKKDGEWVPLESEEPPVIQLSGHGTPLTEKQLKKLAKPVK